MAEKLTLTSYLVKRGKGNALTRIEAEAFGIDYPLVSGWPARHGEMEITVVMLDQLEQAIAAASGGTARRARRGLDAVEGVTPALVTRSRQKTTPIRVETVASALPAVKVSPVPGFEVRRARRYRMRKSAPWT